jgi:hypothetical protein
MSGKEQRKKWATTLSQIDTKRENPNTIGNLDNVFTKLDSDLRRLVTQNSLG